MSGFDFRALVRAYHQLRDDTPVIADVWITVADLVKLIAARYSIESAGCTLTSTTFNTAVSRYGMLFLGQGFDSHPLLNDKGYYRLKHRGVLPESNNNRPTKVYFYFSSSAENASTVPKKPANSKKEWEELVKRSRHVATTILATLEPCSNDVVVRHLVKLKIAKEKKERLAGEAEALQRE